VDHIEGPGPALAAVARARPLHADIERIARALEAACSDFATKPVNPDTLIALISKWKGAGHGTQ
jgi:DNA-binding NtrC family response regulator